MKRLAVLMAKVRDKDTPSFKEATATMTGGEKASYIWEYYRIHIISTIAGFILIFSFVHAFVTNKDTYLNITFVSGFEHTFNSIGDFEAEGEPEPLEENLFFEQAPGIWVDFELVSTLESLFLSEEQQRSYDIQVQNLHLNFETMPVLMTHAGAGVLDIIVTYVPDLLVMTEVDHFVNIADLGWDIPEHVMHNDYGVYLRYFPIFDDYVQGVDVLILGISTATRNIEVVESFFEKMLND